MSQQQIDSHFHVWDLERFSYPWPDASVAPIFKTISLEDYSAAVQPTAVRSAVFVQCLNNHPAEALWVLESQHPLVSGVVAGIDLQDHVQTVQHLDMLCKYDKFVGVRHILDMEEDPGWVVREDVIRGLELVAERGKTFDFLARPHHLCHVPTLARALPQLRIVIDHVAKPVDFGQDQVCEEWRAGMVAAAACPNVYCKISGLVTEVDPVSHALPWSRDTFRKHVDVILQEFGAERCMLGSDWPVLRLTGSNYKDVDTLYRGLIEHLSETEREWVLGGTAERFYKLNVK